MRDDVGTNEFLVRSGRRAILSNRHTRMQMANLANVLDDVIEHYLRARNCVFVGSLVYGRGYDAGSIVPTEKDVSEILTA